ncbi:MAG: ABC-2 type transporter [Candidatus Parvarchaeum acidophilus ARMAN-5]|jgi:ABC-2 type transport system permease protein|uniref:ABC-2 type transporter n=1 Tax=Candidatus Parvarchaeum acidophilus ARMAN-5 TaxID=662762 RepID=D6GUR8_PARA5|nr:MAG: ABC-2 type transporter [Candidatus Parvarchaeum acidophilus ARMAN-5]
MKRNNLSQLYASILENKIYLIRNFPVMLFSVILQPLGFLLVIFFVSHGTLLNVAIMGSLIMTMLENGISLQGDLTHLRRDLGMQDMLVGSPLTMVKYFTGMSLSELVFSIPDLIVLGVLAAIFVHISILSAITIVAVMLLTFVFSISLSFFVSTVSKDILEGSGFMSIVSLLLASFPPVYYLITEIPLPFRYLAYLSPTTYSAIIAQKSIGILSISNIIFYLSWVILIGVSLSLLIFAIKKSSWREV